MSFLQVEGAQVILKRSRLLEWKHNKKTNHQGSPMSLALTKFHFQWSCHLWKPLTDSSMFHLLFWLQRLFPGHESGSAWAGWVESLLHSTRIASVAKSNTVHSIQIIYRHQINFIFDKNAEIRKWQTSFASCCILVWAPLSASVGSTPSPKTSRNNTSTNYVL